MKRFVKKIFIFFLLFSLTLVVFPAFHYYVVGNQYLGNYQAALLDKTRRAQSVDGPKILLIGDSNVPFGFQSELIQEAFHMPVVNMGLHGGLGNAFHENMLKIINLSEGDIIAVCHRSFSDNGLIQDANLAWITLEFHKELWPLATREDMFPLIKAYPKYLGKATLKWALGSRGNVAKANDCYSRAAFNEFGDIAVRPSATYTFTQDSVNVPKINDVCVNRLNELNEYAQAHGATLLVAAYPIGSGEFTPDAALYDEFEAELRNRLDCDVISHYRDYFIPYDLFYDTSLHLTEEGAKIRTELFIQDLKDWMSAHTAQEGH